MTPRQNTVPAGTRDKRTRGENGALEKRGMKRTFFVSVKEVSSNFFTARRRTFRPGVIG